MAETTQAISLRQVPAKLALSLLQQNSIPDEIIRIAEQYAEKMNYRLLWGRTANGTDFWYMPENDRSKCEYWRYLKYIRTSSDVTAIVTVIDDQERYRGKNLKQISILDLPDNLLESVRGVALEYAMKTGRDRLVFAGDVWYLPLQDRGKSEYRSYKGYLRASREVLGAVTYIDDEMRCKNTTLKWVPIEKIHDYWTQSEKELALRYAQETGRNQVLHTQSNRLYIPKPDRDDYPEYAEMLRVSGHITETAYIVTRRTKSKNSAHMYASIKDTVTNEYLNINMTAPGAGDMPGYFEGKRKAPLIYTTQDSLSAPIETMLAIGITNEQYEALKYDFKLGEQGMGMAPVTHYNGGDNRHSGNCIGVTLDLLEKIGVQGLPVPIATNQDRVSGEDAVLHHVKIVTEYASNTSAIKRREAVQHQLDFLHMFPELTNLKPELKEKFSPYFNPSITIRPYLNKFNPIIALDLRAAYEAFSAFKEEIKIKSPLAVEKVMNELERKKVSIVKSIEQAELSCL